MTWCRVMWERQEGGAAGESWSAELEARVERLAAAMRQLERRTGAEDLGKLHAAMRRCEVCSAPRVPPRPACPVPSPCIDGAIHPNENQVWLYLGTSMPTIDFPLESFGWTWADTYRSSDGDPLTFQITYVRWHSPSATRGWAP